MESTANHQMPRPFKPDVNSMPLLRKNAAHWKTRKIVRQNDEYEGDERVDQTEAARNSDQTETTPTSIPRQRVPLTRLAKAGKSQVVGNETSEIGKEKFQELIEQSGFTIPPGDIPRLYQQYHALSHTLRSRGQQVTPPKVIRGMLSAAPHTNNVTTRNMVPINHPRNPASTVPVTDNGKQTTRPPSRTTQRRNSLAPPPPSYDLLPPKQRSALLARRSSLPNTPIESTQFHRAAPAMVPRPHNPPPPTKNTEHSRIAARHSDFDESKTTETSAMARRFRDKVHAAMAKRSLETQKKNLARIQVLEDELRHAKELVAAKDTEIDNKNKVISNLNAKVSETEHRMEEQLRDAISTNEELQAVHHTLLRRNTDFKTSSRRNRQKVDTIFDTVRQVFLGRNFSIQSIVRDMKERIAQIIDAQKVDIYLVDYAHGELISFREKVKSNLPPPMGANVWRGRYPMDCGIVGECVSEAAVQLVENVQDDDRFDAFVDGIGVNGVSSFLCSPIALRNKIGGVIVAVNKLSPRRNTSESTSERVGFASGDVSTLHDLGVLLSLVLEKNKQVQEEEDGYEDD